jgi:hypothetical protein
VNHLLESKRAGSVSAKTGVTRQGVTSGIVSLLIASLVSAPLTASANGEKYQVRKGDTLSEILHRLGLKPVYGKSGSILRTIRMNASLQSKNRRNGDRIFPGEWIQLEDRGFESPQPVMSHTAPFERSEGADLPQERVPSLEIAETVEVERGHEREPEQGYEHERSNLSMILGLGTGYFRIDSLDRSTRGEMNAISRLSAGVDLGAEYRIGDRSSFKAIASLDRYSLERFVTPSHELENSGGSLFSAYGAFGYELASRVRLALGMTGEDRLFFHSTSSNSVQASKVFV